MFCSLSTAFSLAFGSLVALSGAFAQQYPDHPIKLVVGFGAGSAIDSVARPVAEFMAQTLKQPIVLENKPGASGDIATTTVAQAKADGYTILVASTSNFILELAGAAKFEVQKALTPISVAGSAPWVMAVVATSPFLTLKDVVDFARKNPGKLDYATVGGGTPEFLGAILAKNENLDIVPVPYKTTADALPDVLAGRVALWITPMISAVQVHKGAKIRILAVGGDTRSELIKDVPTMKESGYPALDVSSVYYFFAPAGTPASIVQQLNAAAVTALASPAVIQRLAQQGATAQSASVEDTGKKVAGEFARWSMVVKPAAK